MSKENVEAVRKAIAALNAFMQGELTSDAAVQRVDPHVGRPRNGAALATALDSSRGAFVKDPSQLTATGGGTDTVKRKVKVVGRLGNRPQP